MKKHVRFFAALMAMTMMLTGCQSGNATADLSATRTEDVVVADIAQEQDDVEVDAENKEEAAKENDMMIVELKAKYAAAETVTYQEAMYLLPVDHKFVFENVSEDVFTGDVYSDIKVYSDSELTDYVDISIEEDYDNKTVTVEPNLVFNINGGENTTVTDGTWGSRSKFYLVQYRNLETNELYEKPLVTVFTIARELDTPTVKQSVSQDGYYQLTWEAVEGADSYEVYSYDSGMEYADLLTITDKTSVNSSEFNLYWDGLEDIDAEESDEWDEIMDDYNYSANTNMDVELDYFVVARNSNGDVSGMSNMCKVADIANRIPVREDLEVESFFEDTSALVLPTHTNIEMLDGSMVRFLIDYENSEIIQTEETSFQINIQAKNLSFDILPLYFFGMEYDAFMADMEDVIARQKKLETKSVTQESDIDIPYVPTQDNGDEDEAKEPEVVETKAPEETGDTDLNAQLASYLYANSALSAWIGLNFLQHQDVICLDGFEEASDAEYLLNALLEAKQQNPLVDIIEGVAYDYDTNSLYVSYVHTAEETREKQAASIQKAEEIATGIITDDMSDFEKEEAINSYLCRNASYNEGILEYINEDGTISNDVLEDHGDSFLPYGILVENVGVCESYSEAFWMIAKNAGLDVIIETGRLDGVNHEWNRVNIDGSWCIMDVTNNDNEYLPNSYFNLSEETSAGILIPDYTSMMPEFFADYEATDNEKEYYFQKGKYVQDQDEAVDMLSEDIATSNRATVRIAEELGEAEVEEIVQSVANEAELTSGMYFYSAGVLSIVTE